MRTQTASGESITGPLSGLQTLTTAKRFPFASSSDIPIVSRVRTRDRP